MQYMQYMKLTKTPKAPVAVIMSSLAASIVTSSSADPVLPDWTQATFGASSSVSDNTYFPMVPGTLLTSEGDVEGEVVRVERFVSFETTDILGVQNRVVRDVEYIDDVLVEIAWDWYAQSDEGTLWYFGEFVVNYTYDDDGNLVGTDNGGSWIADGKRNLPGVIMFDSPSVGDEYYQEFAPDVALDFALVTEIDAEVAIDLGTFTEVLVTAEGNLFDGPELVEDKLYAPGIGLVLVQELNDDGEPEFEVELRSVLTVAPGDVDGDGDVDQTDLINLLHQWGDCPTVPCAADLDIDQRVGIEDLVILLAAWD